METYLYKYVCSGYYYGKYEGLRNIYPKKQITDQEAEMFAKRDLKKQKGYEHCDITLLVKYKMTVESEKIYSGITKIPFSNNIESKPLSLD